MNAAVGGINKSASMGRYNKGGKAFDRSHYGSPGYQIGQIQPPTLVVSWEGFKEKSREHIGKGGPRGRDYDRFIEDIDYDMPGRTREKIKYKAGSVVGEETYESDIAAIGVPDLRKHRDQLLSAIHAVEGYEKVTIDDVIHSRVNMPLKQYLPILMNSDAQKATFAKEAAAHQKDKEIRGIKEGEGYSMGYDFNLGGLVPGGANGQGKNQWWDFLDWFRDSDETKRGNNQWWDFLDVVRNKEETDLIKSDKEAKAYRLKEMGWMKDSGYMTETGEFDMGALLGNKSVSVPGPPNRPTTTVAYDQQMGDQQNQLMDRGTNMKLPNINPAAMISPPKISTLGISV